MSEEMCVEPCSSHKSFKTAVTWVISVLIVVGGSSITYAINKAEKAVSDLHSYEVSMERMHGDIRVILEKVEHLERAN